MTATDTGALLIGAPKFAPPVVVSGAARTVRLFAAAATGLLVANCANQPQQTARSSGSREIGAFSDVSKYGRASPRVVADGEAVPKGGGKLHIGNPYRIAGRTYYPSDRPVGHTQAGMASWYGEAFHGRKTANGEIYDRRSYTAAHPTMPLPSYARVTNMRNNHSIIVRVNDRGPYHGGRVMDVSERVAHALDFRHLGTTRIRIDYLGKAGLAGSDDVKLAASLRTDGRPATSDGLPSSQATMVASADPVFRPAATPRPAAPVPQAAAFASRPQPNASPIPAVIEDEAPAFAPARGVPLPPDRPFDLNTIPGAASPVQARISALDGVVPLSFAPQVQGAGRFSKANPLAGVAPIRFVAQADGTAKRAR